MWDPSCTLCIHDDRERESGFNWQPERDRWRERERERKSERAELYRAVWWVCTVPGLLPCSR